MYLTLIWIPPEMLLIKSKKNLRISISCLSKYNTNKRLWVSNWNWLRAFLFTWGDFNTVNNVFVVGNDTGFLISIFKSNPFFKILKIILSKFL